MSRPQGPHPSLFQFDTTFRIMLPKGSYMSPHLLSLVNSFEDNLALSLKKLMKSAKDDILSLSWMKLAMESLCETYRDIKALIVDLELPVADWDEEWTDVYLNNSINLLDLCNAFSSEISRLSQGHLMLQCALQNVDSSTAKLAAVHHSLSRWQHHTNAKNARVENCTAILESIIASLNLPKIKNSAKGKVLMRAMYGVKVKTLFISGIFAATFSGSPLKLVELRVPEALAWADTFTKLQMLVNGEIRVQLSNEGATTVLKEVQAVDASVKSLVHASQDGDIPVEAEALEYMASDLRRVAEKLCGGLDLLSTEVDKFFQIVLSGRDTLLCSLRSKNTISNSPKKKDAVK
uniref:Uncharacterized protein n=1 Tax=Kalanchoe fedtschenkoi TaxID=63787 RepID=A0A7N0R8H4_KALFE